MTECAYCGAEGQGFLIRRVTFSPKLPSVPLCVDCREGAKEAVQRSGPDRAYAELLAQSATLHPKAENVEAAR